MTARAPDKEPSPQALLAMYRTMVMARAIERRLWVLDHLFSSPPRGEGGAQRRVGRYAPASGFEVVQVAAAAALRPGHDWVVPCDKDLALCLAIGVSPLT